MGTWYLYESDGTTEITTAATDNFEYTFPQNPGSSEITYKVKYEDNNGCTSELKEIKQEGCAGCDPTKWEFYNVSKNNTVAISGGSSPCTFYIKYQGQNKTDYAVCSGTSCGNPTTSDLCPNSDFLVSVAGEYASKIERVDIWRNDETQGPYCMNFITKGGGEACNALGQTITVTLAMRECPEASIQYECKYESAEWTLKVTPTTTYQNQIKVGLRAYVTPCGEWLSMASTDCLYIDGVISGTTIFYAPGDIDFTKGIKVSSLDAVAPACDEPAAAEVESIDRGAKLITIIYDPTYC